MGNAPNIKRKSIYVLTLVFIFLLLEISARFILPDAKLSRLESILRILDEDAGLFWKVKPRLDTVFEGARVRTNSLGFRSDEIRPKKDGTMRILCLGASPTFGWGVQADQAYPALLEKRLAERFPGRKIEVINAGQIGYTSYQGLILLERRLLKYSPDIITVSYVLNDIDRYRFFRNDSLSDKELPPGNLLSTCFNNILANSRFMLVLRRAVFGVLSRDNKFAAGLLKKQFNVSQDRVEPRDYKSNLINIANLCRHKGIKLVFIKMPVHILLPQLNSEEMDVVRFGKWLSRHYYKLGCEKESLGEYSQARLLFAKAKDFQIFEVNNRSSGYNKIMEDVAGSNALPLVDAVGIFSKQGMGDELFNGPKDPIHPSALGHELIASALFDTIAVSGSLE